MTLQEKGSKKKRVLVIGGTGNIGQYLIPQLIAHNYDVMVMSRGHRMLFLPSHFKATFHHIKVDRVKLERDNKFIEIIKGLKPNIVIDLIAYEVSSVQKIISALRGQIEHYLFCGSILAYGNCNGRARYENDAKNPYTSYGIEKLKIEKLLLAQNIEDFPSTTFHAGNIISLGRLPVNPQGNLSPSVFEKLKKNRPITLPNDGSCLIHQIHGNDLSACIISALQKPKKSIGEVFNVTADKPISLKEYANAVQKYFKIEKPLEFAPWNEWKQQHTSKEVKETQLHLSHNSFCPNIKAKRLLDFVPKESDIDHVVYTANWFLFHKRSLYLQHFVKRIKNKLSI